MILIRGSYTKGTNKSIEEDYWTSISQVYTSHVDYEHYCTKKRTFLPHLIIGSLCIVNTYYLLVGYCWTSQKWLFKKHILKKWNYYYHKVLDWLLANWLIIQYSCAELSIGKGEWRGCLGGEAIDSLPFQNCQPLTTECGAHRIGNGLGHYFMSMGAMDRDAMGPKYTKLPY